MDKKQRDPIVGKQVSSSVATGGGGVLFQARTQSLYLANMLTGLETVPAVAGGRVRSIRFEARYTGAHTDDIYCEVDGQAGTTWRCFVQCKLSLDVVASNEAFKEAFQAAWRDWRQQNPFRQSRDVLSITSAGPASKSIEAARQVCELARASSDAADLITKLEAPRLKSIRVREAWLVFATVSRDTLGDEYSDDELFRFVQCLRFDVHDMATDEAQEMVLLGSLLGTWCGHPEQGQLLRASLTEYCLQMGQKPGTATAASWRTSAPVALQRAFDQGGAGATGLAATWIALCARSRRQLSMIGTTLPNGFRLPRLDLQAELLGAVDQHRVLILAGGPGVGKSSVLANVAQILAESGPLFVFRADELDAPSLDAALFSVGVFSGTTALDAAMSAYQRVTLVIDSLEKALEFSKRGALEELLALATAHESVQLVVTTRSHSLTGLLTHFLHSLSIGIVEVPVLTDGELTKALAASGFTPAEQSDVGLRRVLQVPFYLRLAVSHRMGGRQLLGGTDSDIRKHLWQEGVSPSASSVLGLPERRRKVFDEICFARTEKLAQFVEAPADAEAVEALLHDGILLADPHGRVSPAHDVFEDWSLFFRVEKEVAFAEHDWASLFAALGTHSGLRRAFRAWTAEQADSNNADALNVLEYCLTTFNSPPLWRDEAMIGFLRAQACAQLIYRFETNLVEKDFALLKRLVHLLRVACKGPAASQEAPHDDSELAKEMHIRASMTTPVGSAWTPILGFVERYKEVLPVDAWTWVAALLEDACSATAWYEKTPLSRSAFNIADFYLSKFDERWRHGESLPKRFFGLFIGRAANAPERAKAVMENLISRVEAATTAGRDFEAEERLEHALRFLHSLPLSAVVPSTVCRALTAMYARTKDDDADSQYHPGAQPGRSFGYRHFGVSHFFPASGMSGPFRHLLGCQGVTAVPFIVQLANKAAANFRATTEGYVTVLPVGQSPNSQEHLHSQEFWLCYRGLSVTEDLLASALMALEARLLFDANENLPEVVTTLEWIHENGTSSLTTAVVASVLTAHPELISQRLMGVFQSPECFIADRTRLGAEFGALAVHGGHDGVDTARQRERMESNRLPHRKMDLEALMLRLQLEQPSLRDALFSILDQHVCDLQSPSASALDDGWRLALKRMDVRGLRAGAPVGDAGYRALEIVDLDSDLVEKSAMAAERLAHANQRARLELWVASATGRSDTDSVYFSSPQEVLNTLSVVRTNESDEEAEFHLGREHQVAASIVLVMLGQDSNCDRWAMDMLLDPMKAPRSGRFGNRELWISIARAVVTLVAKRPGDPRIQPTLATIIVHETREVRFALADAAGALQADLPKETLKAISLGLARYAELTARARERSWDRRELAHKAATRLAKREVLCRLSGTFLPLPTLDKQPANLSDWTVALHAARHLLDWPWRRDTSFALIGMAAASEGSGESRRGFDYEGGQQVAQLFASELMRTDGGAAPALQLLEAALPTAPEFSSEVLRRVLRVVEGRGSIQSEFWSIWESAGRVVFKQKALRSSYASTSSFDRVLRELLFVGGLGYPWREGLRHLAFFDERPMYVANCLREVGDTRAGLQGCLELMCGVGRQSSIPVALPTLRDAIVAQRKEPFTLRNVQWHAETVCRVAVHDHREALLRSKPLRAATLDILESLVEAGSTIAFQLRDYLATASPPTQVLQLQTTS